MVDDLKIIPERDDPRLEPRRSPSGGSTTKKGTRPRPRPAPAPKSGSSALMGVLCFMVILVSGAAAYLFLQTQTLTEQRNDLDARVQVLEQKLSVTDESLSESGAAIQTVLKDHQEDLELQMSEIRKLWGVSYDTNRLNIESLQKDRTSQSAQLTSIKSSVSNLDSRVNAAANQSISLVAGFDDVEQQVRGLNDSISSIKSDLGSQKSRVADHSAAIESFDQYRLQINQRLLQLENQSRSAPTQ